MCLLFLSGLITSGQLYVKRKACLFWLSYSIQMQIKWLGLLLLPSVTWPLTIKTKISSVSMHSGTFYNLLSVIYIYYLSSLYGIIASLQITNLQKENAQLVLREAHDCLQLLLTVRKDHLLLFNHHLLSFKKHF